MNESGEVVDSNCERGICYCGAERGREEGGISHHQLMEAVLHVGLAVAGRRDGDGHSRFAGSAGGSHSLRESGNRGHSGHSASETRSRRRGAA